MLVITRQIKAARSLIGWEQHHLASSSGVAISTIRRLESQRGQIGARFETIEKICEAFERAGIEFIGEPNPGVCLKLGDNPSRVDEATDDDQRKAASQRRNLQLGRKRWSRRQWKLTT